VLIERQEHNLPPMVTKDGVTVYRALGFDDPAAQVIMEASRDASVRTASEAGDGTTTATILSEASSA
jgi:chaperonin GroEL